MGDDDHRCVLLGELLHDIEDLADEFRIERARRLVEQEKFRLHGEGPGNRDPLLLPTRKARRIDVRVSGQPDPVEHRHRKLPRRRRFQPAHNPQALHHVSKRRAVRP